MTFQFDTMLERVNSLDGPVLTMYLETNPSDEKWKIRLKNGLKRTGEYIEASQKEQFPLFEKIAKEVYQHTLDLQRQMKNGLICFATERSIIMQPIQPSVETSFFWRQQGEMEQLKTLFERYPRTAFIVVQQDQIGVVESILADVVDAERFELNIDTEDWVQYRGLAYGGIISSSANHRDKFDHRIEVQESRWYRKVAPKVEKYVKNERVEKIFLVGAKELTTVFQQEVPKMKIDYVVDHNYAGKPVYDMISGVLRATERE